MSAAGALKAAGTAGVSITIDSGDLILKAPARPPAAVIDLLTRHKREILALLQPGRDDWSAEDWQSAFDAYAGNYVSDKKAVTSFDGATHAFACCLTVWLNRNPAISPPGCCLNCGKLDRKNDPLLPYGIESAGIAWLHSGCWRVWSSSREVEAVQALAKIGIVPPTAMG